MKHKRLWRLIGVLLLAGGMLYLLLSTFTAQAVLNSTLHTTVDDFTPGTFYHTGLTQQDDGEVALLRIGIAGEWITGNVQGLPPIYGHAMVEHNGYVYVLGGRTGTALDGITPVLTRSVFMSRIQTETYMLEPFTPTTPLTFTAYPDGVYMHSAVVVSDRLYVIGGDVLNGFQSVSTNTVIFADFNDDGTLSEWQFAPRLTDARSRAPAAVVNRHIYVPGGKNDLSGGQATTRTVLYASLDPVGVITQWLTATASLPYPPSGHMVAAYNGRIYVMGGFDGSDPRTYVYFATPLTTTGDITAGGWISTSPMQRAIMGGVGLAFNGELFGLGGVDTFFGNAVDYARSALLNLDSGQIITYAVGEGWYTAPALDPYRVWHAAVTSRDNRYIYVLGGTTGSVDDPIADSALNRGSTTIVSSTTGVSDTNGYARAGWYESRLIELGRDRKVLSFNWTTEIPTTSVTMTLQYRVQDVTGQWTGDWSAPLLPSGTLGLITTTVEFTDTRAFRFQYRANMTTKVPLSYTPYLHRFELVYDIPLPPEFVKTANPPSGQGVLHGQRITYTLVFTTSALDQSPMRNVWITDTLPPNLAYEPGSIIATAGMGIIPDDTHLPELRWNISSLPPGSSGQVGFVAVVSDTAEIGTWLDNRARFISDDTDHVMDYTSHQVVQLVSPVLTKTATPASGMPVLSGQMLTYTLSYSNPNSKLPLEVTITDVLPISTSFGWCSLGCERNGNELRWKLSVGPLAQGQVQFGALVAQAAISGTAITNVGYIVGCVTTAGVCRESVASNSTAHRVMDPAPPALSKQASPSSGAAVLRGTPITYTLVYTNNDAGLTLTQLTITDAMPAKTQFVPGSCLPSGCIVSSGVLSWTVGPLAPGQRGQVSFAVLVAPDVVSGTLIVNTGHVVGCARADKCAPGVASNSTTHIAVTSGGAGQISKSASPAGGSSAPQAGIVLPGALITYTLNYLNPNPSASLTMVTISDVLPADTSFVACTLGCSHDSTSVRWTFTSIAAGTSGQMQFTVQVNLLASDGTLIQNEAILASDQGKVNSNAVYHRIRIPYDLQMTQTNHVTATLPGTTFTYTLSYTNSGPHTLSGVVITDYLGFAPPGEALAPAMPYMTVVYSSTGWQLVQANATGNTFRYNVGTLGPNQSRVLTITVRLASTIPYTVNLSNNRAVITDDGARGYDTNSANQSPSISSPIQGPDLVVSNVQVSPGPYGLGTTFTVSATITNRGLGDVLTWQHLLTPTDSTNNWLTVELYVKPSTFTQPGAPTGPNDHAGGYCGVETSPCDPVDQRSNFLYFFNYLNWPALVKPGDSVVAQWTVPVPAGSSFSLYIQVDSSFWWLNDPAYGRILEYGETNNVAAVGSFSIGKSVYLPLIIRQ